MRVDWAILCRYVEINDGLATIVGGGIDNYTLASYPTPVTATLAVRLVGLPDDDMHHLKVTVLDPQMEPAMDPLEIEFVVGHPPTHPTGWEVNVMIPMVIQFEAPAAGAYSFDISADDTSRTLTFRLLEATPPA